MQRQLGGQLHLANADTRGARKEEKPALNPRLNAEAWSFIAHNIFVLIEKREKKATGRERSPGPGWETLRRQQLARRGNAFPLEVSRAFFCNYGATRSSDIKPAGDGSGGSTSSAGRERPLAFFMRGRGSLVAKLTFLRVSRVLRVKQNRGANGTGSNSALGCIMEFNRWNVAAGGGDEKRGGKGRAG